MRGALVGFVRAFPRETQVRLYVDMATAVEQEALPQPNQPLPYAVRRIPLDQRRNLSVWPGAARLAFTTYCALEQWDWDYPRIQQINAMITPAPNPAINRTSLTDRSAARRLQFITAHAKDGRLPTDIDWRALADPCATTVVYMGVRTMPALVRQILDHGLAADTPCVLVENATTVAERRIAGTLFSCARDASRSGAPRSTSPR